MRKPLVAGNWKLNGSRDFSRALLTDIARGERPAGVEVAILPPFPYLGELTREWGDRFVFGAQDVSEHRDGAYTGEVSGAMLRDVGCRYVLVGHSERRQYHEETSELVARKFAAAKAAGLVPVLCVGETLHQRDAEQTQWAIERQIAPVLEACGPRAFADAVIAYEPVWAIGTGSTATPGLIDDVHGSLGLALAIDAGLPPESLRILYGGSVTPGNAGAILSCTHVAGVLAGGASLHAARFTAILRAASSTPAPVC